MCVENSLEKIERILNNLKKEHLNVVPWIPSKDNYPQYMFLGTDRGILAYLDFFTHIDTGDISCDFDNIIEKVRLASSDLDRPVFYVHLTNDSSSFFCFETDEQVKDRVFNNYNCKKSCFGIDYYDVNLKETGTYEEMVSIFKSIKMGVKV